MSFSADDAPVLAGRSPLQCYAQLMAAFRVAFAPYLGTTVTSVAVSLGPAGELRYPSYSNHLWRVADAVYRIFSRLFYSLTLLSLFNLFQAFSRHRRVPVLRPLRVGVPGGGRHRGGTP